jgi:hypothetical protein
LERFLALNFYSFPIFKKKNGLKGQGDRSLKEEKNLVLASNNPHLLDGDYLTLPLLR